MIIKQDGKIGIYKRGDLKANRKNKSIEKIKISDFNDKSLIPLDILLFIDDNNAILILENNLI